MLNKGRGLLCKHGDKAGRRLVHQLKSRTASQQMFEIINDSGTSTRSPDDINGTLETYYSSLYKSDLPDDDDVIMQNVFSGLSIPKLTLEEQEKLEAQLSLSEITNAIRLTQSGKSSRPDG